jgi:hypothetical protein
MSQLREGTSTQNNFMLKMNEQTKNGDIYNDKFNENEENSIMQWLLIKGLKNNMVKYLFL